MRLPSGRGMAIGAGLLLVGVGAALVWPRDRPSGRELVRRRTIEMVRSAEKDELGFVFDQISEKFRTASGLDKRTLEPMLGRALRLQHWVRIFIVDLNVGKDANGTIDVDAKLLFARSKAERLEELARRSVLSASDIHAEFQKESDGHWRVVWASRRPLSQQALLALHP